MALTSPSLIWSRTLCCETLCLGAKPVHEELIEGETRFHEPNLGVDYLVTSSWQQSKSSGESTRFVAVRRNVAAGPDATPTEQLRYVTATGELVITQDWGTNKQFTAWYKKAE